MNLVDLVKSRVVSLLPRHYFPHPGSHFSLTHCRITDSAVSTAVADARRAHPDAELLLWTDVPAIKEKIQLPMLDPQSDLGPDGGRRRIVILACNSDQNAVEVIRLIKRMKNTLYWPAVQVSPTARYFHRNNLAREVLLEEYRSGLTKFDLQDFENIIQALEATRHLEGVYLEIGVFRGDSAHAALNYMQKAKLKRRCYFLDTYAGFNYAEAKDSADAAWKDTHSDTSLEGVTQLLKDFQVPHSLHRSNIIADELADEINPVVVANIDVDMYEAVAAAFKKVAPRMVRGGIMICEDQGHTPYLIGAYLAQQEFLAEHPEFIPVHLTSGQSFLIKT